MTTQVYSPSSSPSTFILGNLSTSSYDLSNPLPLSYNNNLYFDTVFEGRTGNNENYYGDTVTLKT